MLGPLYQDKFQADQTLKHQNWNDTILEENLSGEKAFIAIIKNLKTLKKDRPFHLLKYQKLYMKKSARSKVKRQKREKKIWILFHTKD